MTTAFVFPGQGSQSLGMQAELAASFDQVAAVYAEASEVLGYDLWRTVQEGPAERLDDTTITQPAMLAAGVAAWRAWSAAGGDDPQFMAGHSLGEYSALVCSGALSFSDAVRVVMHRARLMQAAVPGGDGVMAAILGLDDDAVLEVCATAATIGTAEAVNFNSPGQVVVAGQRAALERAIELAKDAGAKRAIMLPVSVPAHSSLMRPAGEKLLEYLAAADYSDPRITVINSASAAPLVTSDDVRRHLDTQVYSPVRWVDTVNYMIEHGATRLLECGPGKVLTGLNKRIARRMPSGLIDTPESLHAALQQ